MINLITAFDGNYLIGKDHKLPWHYSQDLQYFKKITLNQNVLMGYETYKSLKNYFKKKPFNFKKTYVASLKHDLELPNCTVVSDLQSFMASDAAQDIFIIGGGKIYQQTLPWVTTLYITHILQRHQGNVFFPKIDLSQYQLIQKEIHPQLIFAIYQKKLDTPKC
ncbi:dihydrofolate reductase ['Santalum album' aster yellows phytoplasma]|uniref:dihydrofolate reductase n=1 Tax='Santalum album' aster yellows phytoplasma TaxID=2831467 RepID=A0ABS5LLF2_9MOLU|nr:dihydrofolate reductase ['Santalum album' aster yellows phytoplasma]MBS2993955.1 dihydrofolate reductase ['Santalum album' aster yellows phytoplasma]